MVSQQPHPPKEQLFAFGQGKLAADESTNPPEQSATLPAQAGQSAADDAIPNELKHHARYRVVELIGRGGMGSVYRAEHRLMNRAVAIKLINAQLVNHPLAVERFHREVQAAARLSHPNIVAAYDAEQAGGVHFLVMEFVDGIDLASQVRQRGPLPIAEACRCVVQAAQGLQHAHQQGMVHRDIKPQNLMLSAGNQVRILDFGLAGFATETALGDGNRDRSDTLAKGTPPKPNADPVHETRMAAAAAQITLLGSVMGTPDYIAPEQAVDAHSADIRADIYSLGCTLYFLLTGKPPFAADNVLAKLEAHAQRSPPALTELRSDVPAELSKVAARMLAKDPNRRYQTPAEVVAALAPLAQPERLARRRRVRTLVGVAMAGLLALLAGVMYVEFDKGQFIVETADDQIAVMIGEQGLKIRDAATAREYRLKPGTQRVRSGEYELDVQELPVGLEVKTTKFVLQRGGEARVTVRFAPKEEDLIVDAGRFAGHDGSVSCAIVSPDGRYGISCGSDTTVRVWELATKEEKRVLRGHEATVYGLAVSLDGKTLASSDKARSIRLWNLETGEPLGELTGHTDAVTDLAFMPDQTHLLSVGFDDTLRLWHIADRKLVRTIDVGTKVEKMIPLPDGRRVMLSGAHTRGWGPMFYDLDKGEKIKATPSAYSCMAVSADGRMALIGSVTGLLRVSDTNNGQLVVQMADPRANAARDAAITADGRFAITTTRENQMHLWELHAGKLLSSVTSELIDTVNLSPDGRYALTVGREKGVGVWRIGSRL